MALVSKRNFTRGLFSSVVQARRDVDAWSAGAKRLENVILMKHGGVKKRPGTVFVYELPADDDVTRLLPFTYRPGASYALLMGQATMKPFALGGAVLADGFGITAITKANPGVVTAPYHALSTGDEVYLSGISGMTELNGRVFTVTVIDSDNFSIGVDTTSYGTFTADDGTVRVGAPPAPSPAPTVPSPTPTPTPPSTVEGGGGGYCVVVDTKILMADGSEREAGTLQVGDMVRTRHEQTHEWGDYPVTAITIVEREAFHAVGIPFQATENHRVWMVDRFMSFGEIGGYSVGMRDVAKITVGGAHTYVSNGMLSHNAKNDYEDV